MRSEGEKQMLCGCSACCHWRVRLLSTSELADGPPSFWGGRLPADELEGCAASGWTNGSAPRVCRYRRWMHADFKVEHGWWSSLHLSAVRFFLSPTSRAHRAFTAAFAAVVQLHRLKWLGVKGTERCDACNPLEARELSANQSRSCPCHSVHSRSPTQEGSSWPHPPCKAYARPSTIALARQAQRYPGTSASLRRSLLRHCCPCV